MSEHDAQQLTAYLHGELSPTERIALEAHLASCASCNSQLHSLRRAHEILSQVAQSTAPHSLWEKIQRDLPAETAHGGRPARRRAPWLAVAALAAAAALTLWLLPRGDGSRVELARYFSRLEAAAADPSALASTERDFRPLTPAEALASAGMSDARRSSPLPEFSLWQGRRYHSAAGDVTQLVYRHGDRAFSVFLAPHALTMDFGRRRTERVRWGDWECTQVESKQLALYWSASKDRQSLLVAKRMRTSTCRRS